VRTVTFVIALSLGLPSAALAQIDLSILPADRATLWNPGVPGGVPVRSTICATLNASTYGNGAQDASAAIQAAIASCPVGQVLKLSAGAFTVNNYVILNKGITLRGAGPKLTTLRKTNGATPDSYTSPDQQPVIIIGASRWPATDEAHAHNLTVDGNKGDSSVTVANSSGLAAGQFVIVDEDNYNTASWLALPNRNRVPTAATIWASDRAVFMRHNPPDPGDDPFPDSLTWFSRPGRPVNEVKEIASVTANVVTFTTPLHISYRASKAAQLTPFTASVRNAGLEDVTVVGGSDGNVRFEAAAYSWVKNVEDTVWLGEGVALDYSFRCEIRDSYIHDGAWPEPGGGGYALSSASASAEWLIENNIVLQANKVMVVRSSGAGSVVAYNYMDDGHIRSNPAWVEVGINGSHMVGGHHILFEGNESFNYDSDNTHGNAIYMTVFRNHLIGFREDYTGMWNARTAGLMYGSWWHSFVGNVLGVAGQMSAWVYEDPGDWSYGDGSAWGNYNDIWKLGYDPQHWEQAADPQVRNTVLRDGNFDFLTNAIHWDRASRVIPPSLYLTSRPAFFGSNPWPWVDPTGAAKLSVLPARQRYDSMVNAAPSAPTNLRFIR
jgi:hypothetical protein